MKIITLTLNPAFDIHCYAESFELYRESVAEVTERDAGGKGINISRALCEMNIPNTAFVVLGKDNGEEFKQMLSQYKINFEAIEIDGRIRENITVHLKDKPETRLSFRGFNATDLVLDSLEDRLLNEITEESYLTFTGSIPSGISHKRVLDFLQKMRKKGVRLVIDSKSITKEDLINIKPWLIKPNEEEVSSYIGHEAKSLEDCVLGARELNAAGIENVMITLGKKGALLARDGEIYIASAPEVKAISTIGAGDSSIGGFLYSEYNGKTVENSLKTAVAYGTAACLTNGTNPPLEKDIESIIREIKVTKL